MNRQTKREIKRELLLFGSSVFKAAVFCGFVLAFSWSFMTLMVAFQIINVTG
tara:strand:+ start:348 stop:503 length:156 start_codon:yes stop_codon:yes gene_type:complete